MDRIDSQGFRANVGIIVTNGDSTVLLGGRVGQAGWQFPQGGIRVGETPEDAMYRELREEIGLDRGDVAILGSTKRWLRYRLPGRYLRRDMTPLCIGQKQRWYLLRLLSDQGALRLDSTNTPEFDRWRWVDYWQPVAEVIFFKRRVYQRALEEFAPLLFPGGAPPCPQWPPEWRLAHREP